MQPQVTHPSAENDVARESPTGMRVRAGRDKEQQVAVNCMRKDRGRQEGRESVY